ncbi:MAG: dTDP-4-dehydrorhamnose reductase, partial [Burkholderiaceae bacterium]
LGNSLLPMLQKYGAVWAPSRFELDFANPETIPRSITEFRPGLIVNAAAYTAVDAAEQHRKLCNLVNVKSPRSLAQAAQKLDIPIIHFSTDYVFDGSSLQPYKESDQTNPLQVYGQSKLDGEIAVKDAWDRHWIVRTSWVVDPASGVNVYRTMFRLFCERKEVRVVNDQIGAPTSVAFLVKNLETVVRKLALSDWDYNQYGLYHLVGHRSMSWFEFAKEIFHETKGDHRNSDCKIIPIATSELKVPARRPSNSVLCYQKWVDNFGLVKN